jgi:hypothetical protein
MMSKRLPLLRAPSVDPVCRVAAGQRLHHPLSVGIDPTRAGTPYPARPQDAQHIILGVYPDYTVGCQGVRRTRKGCNAQPRALLRSRVPFFHRRIQSLMRERCTPLVIKTAFDSLGSHGRSCMLCHAFSRKPFMNVVYIQWVA